MGCPKRGIPLSCGWSYSSSGADPDAVVFDDPQVLAQGLAGKRLKESRADLKDVRLVLPAQA
jgi:hypothetical protein